MTTAKLERCFSTLKRIKIYWVMNDQLNHWIIEYSIESNIISEINDFHEKIIEMIFHAKNKKIDNI